MSLPSKSVKCELRSLISHQQYETLKAFFSNVGTSKGESNEETRYFEGEYDLRLQRSETHAKIWLKKGKQLDVREEIELRVEPDRFPELERLFTALDYKTAVIWKRHRMRFEWDGIAVALDDIKGYGSVVEFEQACAPEKRIETLETLRVKMALLGLRPTPKPILHERFSYYRDHWENW